MGDSAERQTFEKSSPKLGIHICTKFWMIIGTKERVGGQIRGRGIRRHVHIPRTVPRLQELIQGIGFAFTLRITGIVHVHFGIGRVGHIQAGQDNGVVGAIKAQQFTEAGSERILLPKLVRINPNNDLVAMSQFIRDVINRPVGVEMIGDIVEA